MKVTARAQRLGPIHRRARSLIRVSRPSAFESPRRISSEPPAPPCAAVNEPGMTVASTISPRGRGRTSALASSLLPLPLVSPHPPSMLTHPHVLRPVCPASLFMGATPHSLKDRAKPHPSRSGPAILISIYARRAWAGARAACGALASPSGSQFRNPHSPTSASGSRPRLHFAGRGCGES